MNSPPPAPDLDHRPQVDGGSAGVTVKALVLEDCAEMRKRIFDIVSSTKGISTVTEMVRLASARALLREQHFDLVILDLMLPDGNGLDLLEELSGSGATVIVFSAAVSIENRRRAMQGGAYALVDKAEPEQLEAALQGALRICVLRNSERKFRAIVEHASEGLALIGADGRLRWVSTGRDPLLGYPPEEMVDRNAFELLHPEDLERVSAMFSRLVVTRALALTTDARFKNRGGEWRWVEVAAVNRIQDPAVGSIILQCRDVTEQHALTTLHEALRRSERMASLGMLLAGTAHEINNPLAALMLCLDSGLERAGSLGDPGLLEELVDAREAALTIRQIVNDLLAFSHVESVDPEVVDLELLLEAAIQISGFQLRNRARVDRRFGSRGAVIGNGSQLGQVFLNLISNAAKAIPEGNVRANEVRVVIGLEADGRTFVEIADTGTGMSPQVVAQLSTPVFTTKPAGAGAGLGLWISRGILTRMGAELEVQSQPGRGSAFRIRFPVVETTDGG